MGEWENDLDFFLSWDPMDRSHEHEPATITFVEMTGETSRAIEAAPVDGNGFPAWFPKREIGTNLKKIGDQGHITMPEWLFKAKVREGFDWMERLWWDGTSRP